MMAALTLGGWIRTRRKALGLSVAEVAWRSGQSQWFIAEAERGRFVPTDKFANLAKALRCSVRDLRLADEFTPCTQCGRTGPRGRS